jgi:6-phosphogluconate dehydrogenase
MSQANIGVVGLAVMGSNLARNLASREGNRVAVYNRSWDKTEHLVDAHPEANFLPAKTVAEFAESLAKPRTAIIMVKAGAGTDAVIDQLCEVFEPGDIIVDGGNALFTDTIRREKAVRETGINFVGAGISGGEEGALLGPSIMPGGSAEAWETLGPILKSIAAVVDGEPCVTHIGTDGAGHFVKMIHNGIEYIGEHPGLFRSCVGCLSWSECRGIIPDRLMITQGRNDLFLYHNAHLVITGHLIDFCGTHGHSGGLVKASPLGKRGAQSQ